jgi:LuxR family maltose regulon positive regulatory protein
VHAELVVAVPVPEPVVVVPMSEPVVAVPLPEQAVREDPLLESKFEIPDRPRFMAARPRLLELMSSRADSPITLIVGPAGSGKTQLAASFAGTPPAGSSVAWLTLEEDEPTSTFWTYVVEALRRADVVIPPTLIPPSAGVDVDRSFLVRLATTLARRTRPVLLVLDDVSTLGGEQWATDLEYVLRHAGPLLRLVLVGRWDPPLPLHRYRLAGRLTEIRSQELSFTAPEAGELLRLHGVELGPEKLLSLLEHTEGWAAGLRLFALALQDHRDADHLVDTITGNEATISEYFVDEVLRCQPPHVRSFLLEASVLDKFTPELVEAVTGRSDARRLLIDLERHNVFVQPAAEFSAAYRFHRLFAELLQAQLLSEAPERAAQLHRHAAAWFAAQGQTFEAVNHAVKARDWSGATTIIVEHYAIGGLALHGRADPVGALLRHLPDELPHPEAAMVAAALALGEGAVDGCARQLDRARELVICGGWQYSEALALADLLLGVLLTAARDDHEQVLQLSPAVEIAVEQAPPADLARHPELRVLTLAAKGLAQSRLGAVEAATVTLTAVTTAEAVGCERVQISCLQHLAVIEAHRGWLAHAEKLATEAIEAAGRYGLEHTHRPAAAHLALAWVAMERYDVDATGRHLRGADARQHPHTDGLVAAGFALVKARRLQARGELRGALTLLEQAGGAGAPAAPEWLIRELAVSRTQLLITMGRPDEALDLVREFAEPRPPELVAMHAAALGAHDDAETAREIIVGVTSSSSGLDTPIQVNAWLVLATLTAQLGEDENARSALRHALRLATVQSQRRAVQQVWAHLRRLLREDDDLVTRYRALLGAGPPGQRQADQEVDTESLIVVEPLSRREMEVLRGVASMLPTEEIAASLYVSVNTVKTHIRSILRKLSASRRNEAVRRARELGLI